METEELKERYKVLPLWARLGIAALVGALPALYIYYEEGDVLAADLETVIQDEESARIKFEKAREKKTNVPKLEEQLAFTEEQLVKAKKKLPDSYRIEDVLQRAATIGKEVGVRFVSFDPGDEKRGTGDYRYMEMPIATEIDGTFNQIAAFMDRVVHLESSVFVRNIAMAPVDEAAEGAVPKDATGLDENALPTFEEAQRARRDLRVKGKFDLVIFRGMTEAEATAPDVMPEGMDVPTEAPEVVPVDKPAEGEAPPA
jgi:type IV pilus assembly protein PilO